MKKKRFHVHGAYIPHVIRNFEVCGSAYDWIFAQPRKNIAGFALILGVFLFFLRNFDEKTRVLQQLKFFSLKTSVKNWLKENARTLFSGRVCFPAHQGSENNDKHPSAFQISSFLEFRASI